jgi:hypothetical protein
MPQAASTAQAAPPGQQEWADEVRYDVIIAIPPIRDMIERNWTTAIHSANTQKLLDGKSSQSKLALAALLQEGMARKGRNVIAERAQLVQRPVGWVLADLACVLAGGRYTVRLAQQGSDGCVLECVIPRSPSVLIGGTMTVTVERTSHGTGVRAVAHLPGLLRDWGVSRRIFDHVFDNIK